MQRAGLLIHGESPGQPERTALLCKVRSSDTALNGGGARTASHATRLAGCLFGKHAIPDIDLEGYSLPRPHKHPA